MSVGENTTKAKEWCNEARRILKLGMLNTKGRSMSSRAETIAKELVALEKAVKSGKMPLLDDEVNAYVLKFTNMSKALKEAATAKNETEVDVQFGKLEELKVELAKVAKMAKQHAAYLLLLAKVDGKLNTLKSHGGAGFVESEIDAMEKDIAKAKEHVKPPKHEYDKATVLLETSESAIVPATALANKCTSANTINWSTWGTTEFQKLKKHAQKDAFKVEIARLQKQLDASKSNLEKGLTNVADKCLNTLHWESKPQVELADLHGLYAAKRDGVDGKPQLESLKTAPPTTSNDAIATQVAAIQKKLEDAEKKAGSRKYPAAMALLDEAKIDCAAAKLLKVAHGAYVTELGIVDPLVLALPVDTDPAIGPESKAIRAKLALAKAAALPTKGEYSAAKELLVEVKAECVAAQKIANEYTKNKLAGETAVKNSDPALGLEELRKLWTALKSRDADKILVVKLGEIETAITEANTALTT